MKIQGLKDGPILVFVTKAEENGEMVEQKGPLALCRCGQSDKKPKCDGTHKTCGFKAEAVTREVE